jgi:diguanylate cyclase (GGDEF)-like protein/PAS domain S-box-containing protein
MVQRTSLVQPKPSGVESSHVLSLKWKAMILTSAVLIAITAAYSVLSYLNLISQFRQQREIIHHRQEQEINGLISQSLLQLSHLAGTVQNLKGMASALLSGERGDLYSAFDRHWIQLQLEFGLDIARFYNIGNQLLAAWGQSGLPDDPQSPTPESVEEANQRERPVMGVDCGQHCVLYAVSPLLVEGQHIGALLIASPLTDIVLGFKNLSETDVGLLITTGQDNVATVDDKRYLTAWQAEVWALTNSEQNLKLLRRASVRYPDLNSLKGGVTINFDGRNYEIALNTIDDFAEQARGKFVVITDITEPLHNIRTATRDNLLLGGLGLVASVLLLLMLLRKPMSRLRATADTLPLLGQGEFERARSAILTRMRLRHWFKDEIDILDATAVGLSRRLERLEQEVSDRTFALNERMQELKKERDFISSLLNTAQVIVLTQSKVQRIRMVNQYGEAISGYGEREIVTAKTFPEFIAADDYTTYVAKGMKALIGGGRNQFRHEAQLICKDGAVREIAWLHSRLESQVDGEPAILSIGLDITEQKQAQQRLSWLADHDPLCGLFNRRRFQNELERALAESRRYGHEGALLFFDLDQFKYINDTSGHQAGDMLLKVVANTLSHVVRDTDVVGRLGGDEFAVLIGHTDKAGAIKAARKISDALSAIQFPADERCHSISVSTGIALFPHHGMDVQVLLANADLAMYRAKETGRNRWYLFSLNDPSRDRMKAQVYWKERVEEALADDRFVLHFQPIMDLSTNNITHVEALLRMVDKDNGLVSPGAFIDACERSGLIHAIDHLVLRKGISQVAELKATGHDICVSLNLSGQVFEDPDLLSTLAKLLKHYEVDPNRLIFEITETAAVADFVAARYLMEAIKSMGCSFALDDFGTGFSSLRYLKQLPADYVKIDGSFIRDLYESRDEQVLVKAITDVAKGFGKKTIAEFVERNDVLTMLRSYGVDFAQGYRVGRPVVATELFARLGEPAIKTA